MEYYILLLLLWSAKFAAGIPSEPAAINSSTSGPHSFEHFPSIIVSAPQRKETSNLSLGFDLPNCRAEYGSDMSKASCLNAWQSIPPNLQKRRYGRRAEGIFDAPLPQRFLSGKTLLPWRMGRRTQDSNLNIQPMVVVPLISIVKEQT